MSEPKWVKDNCTYIACWAWIARDGYYLGARVRRCDDHWVASVNGIINTPYRLTITWSPAGFGGYRTMAKAKDAAIAAVPIVHALVAAAIKQAKGGAK